MVPMQPLPTRRKRIRPLPKSVRTRPIVKAEEANKPRRIPEHDAATDAADASNAGKPSRLIANTAGRPLGLRPKVEGSPEPTRSNGPPRT